MESSVVQFSPLSDPSSGGFVGVDRITTLGVFSDVEN